MEGKYDKFITTRYGKISLSIVVAILVSLMIYALVWEYDLGFWFGF